LDEDARSPYGTPQARPITGRRIEPVTVTPKEAARARVTELVQHFAHNETDYLRPTYNETQARTDFITPLLEAFDWDVHNAKAQPLSLREVIEEATVEVGVEKLSKRPDYELRLARQRKLFVEAKKPHVRIDRDRAAAFQTRRYGYSASLPISVLTTFHQLAIYDCRPIPADTDDAHVARILLVGYRDFVAHFDALWDSLSREVVYSGEFDRRFAVGVTRHGTDQFDDLFLSQVRRWRGLLAVDIHTNTPGLTSAELTYAVQLFLSRIVFLRICEDRDIEKYETLKSLDSTATFTSLMALIGRAEAFFNSGLFRILDDEGLHIHISDATLQTIIAELYYPQSPYTFAVVETEVLGEIYEQFLGETITVNGGAVEIIAKPEVRESGGVVPTPRYIVDAIIVRTLTPAIAGKSPTELEAFTIADICCGSGIFLLSAYEFLLEHYLTWYLANDRASHIGRTIYEVAAGQWRLAYEEKRRILLAHIRGVDIDPHAVEVARFSLMLKLIEGETAADLQDYVTRAKARALPPLDTPLRSGNTLVSRPEWVTACGLFPPALTDGVNPFTWTTEFPQEMQRGGFDVIVANPPYIRIQNMQTYSPQEVAYYQNPASPYTTARQDNFDKYALFVERALMALIRPGGRIGMIVPHKFMTIQSGRALRRLIAGGRYLDSIVHFGVKQVFGPGTANYTCILVLNQAGSADIAFEQAGTLEEWRYGKAGPMMTIPAATLGEEAWEFADTETRALLARIRAAFPDTLETVAEIFVGVQTSADDVYILHPTAETPTTVTVPWGGRDWIVEKAVLRPCLHDVRNMQPFARPTPNAWMIFPYEFVTNAGGRMTAALIQPADFQTRFPQCWDYLLARQAELAPRSVTGGTAGQQQWYQYGRSQSLTKFDTPKIILPILSRGARYAYDDANITVTGGGNGPYYMVRPRPSAAVSNQFLLAVLNHPMAEAFVRTNTSPFRGGYYSHGKQFIAPIPIPMPDDAERTAIEQLVDRLIATLQAAQTARTPHQRQVHERDAADLHRQIDDAVSAIYGLTPAEIDIARAVPVPS
jgi:type I restriction-modification system DNA methylase subunit